MILYDIYKYGLDDDSNESLNYLYDYIEEIVESLDLYGLKRIMNKAVDRTYLFNIAIDMERRDYDNFCREFKEVSNADNVEKETGERPFWSKEDFEFWLSRVEVRQ